MLEMPGAWVEFYEMYSQLGTPTDEDDDNDPVREKETVSILSAYKTLRSRLTLLWCGFWNRTPSRKSFVFRHRRLQGRIHMSFTS